MEPPKPLPRESERRFATIVFADISGFTTLSEQSDPEDMTEVTNRCFEVLEAAVRTHGGHVDKYMGDCIMALFGVPQTLERAPVLAVHAAVEMMARLPAALRARPVHVPLDLHVGINSGLVFAGEVGGATKHDFTVMGDTVNLAQRLKDAAPRGAIWVGPLTWRYTRDDFEYEALQPQALKGKSEIVTAYRLIGVKRRAGAGRPGPTDGAISSALVGREVELCTLERSLGAVATEGTGGIVTVLGEAGMGKSRLVGEALAGDAVGTARVLRGAAIAVGRTLRFHPFVDLLRAWAAIDEGDGDGEAVHKLAAATAAAAPEEASELVPFLATILGLRLAGEHEARLRGIEGEGLEKLIHKSVRDLFARLAAARPLVVVLEDLHWADGSSIDLLEALLRLVDEARVCFVHVLRPDAPGPGQRILAAARTRFAARHAEITLEPLTPKQGDRLLRNLLGVDDLPYATLGPLLHKADGNPFFLEEVARSLIEEGAIEHRDGRWHTTAKLATVVIPETVQEVILSRLDRLPEPVRRTIQVASVIGRSFRPRVLAAVLGSDRELAWALGHLKKRQLIVQRPVDDDVEYVFKHALGQETIYGAIAKSTRRTLHAAVAAAIETHFADRLPEFYGMLAYHYSRADDPARAEDYLFKAGDEAARSAASREALEYFQHASRLYFEMHGAGGDPGKKALLETNIAMALMNKGALTEAVPHFNEALRHLGQPPLAKVTRMMLRGAVDLLAVVLHLYFPRRPILRRRDGARAREAIQVRYHRAKAQTTTDTTRFFFDTIGSIRELSRTDPRTVPGASGMYAGGAALFSFSGVSSAIGARFLTIAGRLRDGEIGDEIAYRSMRFIHHYLAGDWSAEHLMDPRIVEEGLRYGQLWDASAYLGLHAERALRQGRFDEADGIIGRLAAIADAYDSDFARSNHDGERATLLIEQRRCDDALDAVRHYATSRLEPLFNLLALGWEAKLRALCGEHERATAVLAEGERVLRALGQVPPYHRSAFLVSRLRIDVGAFERELAAGGDGRRPGSSRARARRSARAALANARRVAVDRVETYRLVGRFELVRGRRAAAIRCWQRSLAESGRLGALPERARTHREIAARLASAPAPVADLAPPEHAVRARTLFTELGLAWDLARMDGTPEPGVPAPETADVRRTAGRPES